MPIELARPRKLQGRDKDGGGGESTAGKGGGKSSRGEVHVLFWSPGHRRNQNQKPKKKRGPTKGRSSAGRLQRKKLSLAKKLEREIALRKLQGTKSHRGCGGGDDNCVNERTKRTQKEMAPGVTRAVGGGKKWLIKINSKEGGKTTECEPGRRDGLRKKETREDWLGRANNKKPNAGKKKGERKGGLNQRKKEGTGEKTIMVLIFTLYSIKMVMPGQTEERSTSRKVFRQSLKKGKIETTQSALGGGLRSNGPPSKVIKSPWETMGRQKKTTHLHGRTGEEGKNKHGNQRKTLFQW